MADKPDRYRVASHGVSVAMAAKSRTLEPEDVGALRIRAEELLSRSDPLFFAVTEFATQFELYRWQPDEWVALGQTLHHQIDVAIQPDPPDLERSDVYG